MSDFSKSAESISNLFDLHSKGESSKNVSKKWDKDHEKYKEPLDIAEKLWDEGETNNHYQMALYLNQLYPELPVHSLKRKLKPIAIKHGKFWNPGKLTTP